MNVIENLQALLAAIEAQPEKLFDLNYWKLEEPCGTLFCVAGLACTMPKFQALGLNWGEHGHEPMFNGVSMWRGGGDTLFGEGSMAALFRTSGEGINDADLGFDYERDEYGDVEMGFDVTDKELAIARIKFRIAQLQNEAV